MGFFYKRVAPKVVDVFCSLPPVVIPYIEEHDKEIKKALREKGRVLQVIDPDVERLWVLFEDWELSIKVEYSPGVYGIIKIKARAGWTLDFASIPGAAESIEKRDDRDGLIAAGAHDAFFAIQFPFFDIANCFFYQIGRYYGMGRFQSWRRWRAVQSRFGWSAWEKSSLPSKVEDEKYFLSVEESPYQGEDEIEQRRRFFK